MSRNARHEAITEVCYLASQSALGNAPAPPAWLIAYSHRRGSVPRDVARWLRGETDFDTFLCNTDRHCV